MLRQLHLGKKRMRMDIVWRNPLTSVQAQLKVEEANNPYYGWAEQATKIRRRRANWDIKRIWAA